MRRGNSSEVYLRRLWNTNGYTARGGSLATSIWHINALNDHGQGWTSFLAFVQRICIYGIGGTFLGFPGQIGRSGASGRAWKRFAPPTNQGIEPPRLYPTH